MWSCSVFIFADVKPGTSAVLPSKITLPSMQHHDDGESTFIATMYLLIDVASTLMNRIE